MGLHSNIFTEIVFLQLSSEAATKGVYKKATYKSFAICTGKCICWRLD